MSALDFLLNGFWVSANILSLSSSVPVTVSQQNTFLFFSAKVMIPKSTAASTRVRRLVASVTDKMYNVWDFIQKISFHFIACHDLLHCETVNLPLKPPLNQQLLALTSVMSVVLLTFPKSALDRQNRKTSHLTYSCTCDVETEASRKHLQKREVKLNSAALFLAHTLRWLIWRSAIMFTCTRFPLIRASRSWWKMNDAIPSGIFHHVKSDFHHCCHEKSSHKIN